MAYQSTTKKNRDCTRDNSDLRPYLGLRPSSPIDSLNTISSNLVQVFGNSTDVLEKELRSALFHPFHFMAVLGYSFMAFVRTAVVYQPILGASCPTEQGASHVFTTGVLFLNNVVKREESVKLAIDTSCLDFMGIRRTINTKITSTEPLHRLVIFPPAITPSYSISKSRSGLLKLQCCKDNHITVPQRHQQ